MYTAHVLSIAGSDSSGGAGIQADLKTFSAHGVYGMSVITSVTAQNTHSVTHIEDLSTTSISAQMDAVFSDIVVHAVKIGMVSKTETIRCIAENLIKYSPQHIVLDPVMISKSGDSLLSADSIDTLKTKLLPLATLITPNIPEASMLTGIDITDDQSIEKAARMLLAMGAQNVLIKGGHHPEHANDYLFTAEQCFVFTGEKIDTQHSHGTGCTLSSSIASNLARGFSLHESVAIAKKYITEALLHAQPLGHGHGPVHHFHAWDIWTTEKECV
ncbi:MAG: bifunctional hydroxymethylpyrimidine kinase/phosphomethylpyrimidine kinase [Bacilli bacterium]